MSTKQQEPDAGVRDHELERDLLIAAFVLWYGAMLKAVHTIVLRILNLDPLPLTNPEVQRMVLEARASAVAVDATTQKMIAQRIAQGASLGLTPQEIAYGTADFPGIAGLFDATWKNRPLTVAQTELQKAQLHATTQQFQKHARGQIVGWLASDGDYDAQCAARDGRIFPPNSPPDLLHPHCRLVVSPVLR